MSLLRIYSLTGATLVAVSGALVWFGGNKKTPEQRETLRRQRISAQGRLTDGTVLELREFDSGDGATAQMVVYSYDLAGVHYECAQDVTPLRSLLDLRSCPIGVAASVRFDPKNPGNSIVAAETWCGLRTAAHATLSALPG
jgi:hypothetical protein